MIARCNAKSTQSTGHLRGGGIELGVGHVPPGTGDRDASRRQGGVMLENAREIQGSGVMINQPSLSLVGDVLSGIEERTANSNLAGRNAGPASLHHSLCTAPGRSMRS